MPESRRCERWTQAREARATSMASTCQALPFPVVPQLIAINSSLYRHWKEDSAGQMEVIEDGVDHFLRMVEVDHLLHLAAVGGDTAQEEDLVDHKCEGATYLVVTIPQEEP